MRGKLIGGKEVIIDKVELDINITGSGNADIIISNGIEEFIVSSPFPKTLFLPSQFRYTFRYRRIEGGMVKWIFNGEEIFTQSFQRYLFSNPSYLRLEMNLTTELYIFNNFGGTYYVDGIPYTDIERMFNFPTGSSHSVYIDVGEYDIPVYDRYVRLEDGTSGTLIEHQEEGIYNFVLSTHSNLYLNREVGGGGIP